MTLYPVLSQIVYPGVGDIDDCAVISTYWAARAAGYSGALPTVAAFRKAAGRPDQPGPTGLTNDQVWAGVTGTGLRILRGTEWSATWPPLEAAVRGGARASLAVLSSALPSGLRFGFNGPHRVGVQFEGSAFYVANPLAANNSRPLACRDTTLAAAALAVGIGHAYAVTFPLMVRYALFIAHGAEARIYRLDTAGRIVSWVDAPPWSGTYSHAPCTVPVRRTTVDGESHAMTVRVEDGAFAGKTLAAIRPGISVRQV